MANEFLKDLRRVLDYNSETGVMTWKVSFANNSVKAGSLAGCVNKQDGRLYIKFQNKQYLAHRLAWLLTHNKWPEQMIDHIDGNPLNNCLANLRDVSNEINQQNRRKAQSNNQTGLLGVNWHEAAGKFVARIRISGKNKHLGYFLTAEAAHEAYLAVKRKLHEGCSI